MILIEKELEKLKIYIDRINELELLNFDEAKITTTPCIYIVFNEKYEIAYIGKTSRSGKLRLREMGQILGAIR